MYPSPNTFFRKGAARQRSLVVVTIYGSRFGRWVAELVVGIPPSGGHQNLVVGLLLGGAYCVDVVVKKGKKPQLIECLLDWSMWLFHSPASHFCPLFCPLSCMYSSTSRRLMPNRNKVSPYSMFQSLVECARKDRQQHMSLIWPSYTCASEVFERVKLSGRGIGLILHLSLIFDVLMVGVMVLSFLDKRGTMSISSWISVTGMHVVGPSPASSSCQTASLQDHMHETAVLSLHVFLSVGLAW